MVMHPASSTLSALTSTLLVIALFPVPAWSQDDDDGCEGTTADVTACLIQKYKRADVHLNAVYQEAIKSANEYGPSDLANLKDTQRKWIAYLDAACEAELALFHGGTAGGPTKLSCLLRLTDQRTHDLREAYRLSDDVSPVPGQAKEPTLVFKPALEQIKSRTRIAIMLPSKLPPDITESRVASGEVTQDGYFISLYYSKDTDASYAAGFGGSTVILQDRNVPRSTRVALSNGRTGIFRPVFCGPSCAPAKLWWEQDGVMYHIQLVLSPDLPDEEQQKILVETANSTVAAR